MEPFSTRFARGPMTLSRWCPILSSRKMAAFALIAVGLMVGYAQPITAQGGMSGHSMDMREAVPPEKLPPPLKLTGIGNAHIHITATPEAQMWFDHGLNLLHDFWDYWNYVHNLMYAIANLMEAGQLSEATALSGKLRDARGQLANTLYPWSPRAAIARLDPRLPVALRAADWAAALGLLKSGDPPPALPNLQFLARQLTQFAVGMQALEEHDLPRAEAASAQFDAELWRLSNRLKDEADAKANEKDKDPENADTAPPKLQVMPDALPKPLLNNLSILSLELRGGLFMAKKLTGDAKKLYAQAAQEERALGYREPPATFVPLAKPRRQRSWLLRLGPTQRRLTERRSSSGRARASRCTVWRWPASWLATSRRPRQGTRTFWRRGNPPIPVFRNSLMRALTSRLTTESPPANSRADFRLASSKPEALGVLDSHQMDGPCGELPTAGTGESLWMAR